MRGGRGRPEVCARCAHGGNAKNTSYYNGMPNLCAPCAHEGRRMYAQRSYSKIITKNATQAAPATIGADSCLSRADLARCGIPHRHRSSTNMSPGQDVHRGIPGAAQGSSACFSLECQRPARPPSVGSRAAPGPKREAQGHRDHLPISRSFPPGAAACAPSPGGLGRSLVHLPAVRHGTVEWSILRYAD